MHFYLKTDNPSWVSPTEDAGIPEAARPEERHPGPQASRAILIHPSIDDNEPGCIWGGAEGEGVWEPQVGQ